MSPYAITALPTDSATLRGSPREWGQAAYELPPLPYAYDALEGFLSAEMLEIHHKRHHQKYVDGLNQTLAQLTDARREQGEARIQGLTRALAFHGSGHVLHSLYWNSMSPQGGGEPEGDLKKGLEVCFGSVPAFRQHFTAACRDTEASGWGLLSYEPVAKRLLVSALESHEQMGFQGTIPLLACDVWEHAYYLKYRHDRLAYVKGFMDVIHWDCAARRLAEALGTTGSA